MKIVVRMAVNGSDKIQTFTYTNENDTKTVQSYYLSNERIIKLNIFQDFNTVFKLINFELDLQDLDGTPLDGNIELTSGRFKMVIPYTVMRCVKSRRDNNNDGEQFKTFVYEVKAIGIPFNKINAMLKKKSGTIKNPISHLKQYFDEVSIDQYCFNDHNYFKLNGIQQLKHICHELFFNKESSLTVPIIDDDMSFIKIKDISKINNKNTNLIYIDEMFLADRFEDMSLYQLYNINEDSEKIIYKNNSDHLTSISLKMDINNNLNDNYYLHNRDEIVNNNNDIFDGKVENNNELMYINSITKVYDSIFGEALRDAKLGNILYSGNEKHLIIGMYLNMSYDSDLISGSFQLTGLTNNGETIE